MRELFHPALSGIRIEQVLYALSDSIRLEIVKRLSTTSEMNCSEFEDLGKKSNLSHHYRTLRENGLIYIRREGRYSYLSLRREEIDQRFPGLLKSILAVK